MSWCAGGQCCSIIEGGVAVAKRALDGPDILVDGELAEDYPSIHEPVKFVRETGVWRVENCGDYVPG